MITLEPEPTAQPKIIDKEWLRKMFDEIRPQLGYTLDPNLTPEMVQQTIADEMRAQGIDPYAIVYHQDSDDSDD